MKFKQAARQLTNTTGIRYTQAIELMAAAFGYRNYNALAHAESPTFRHQRSPDLVPERISQLEVGGNNTDELARLVHQHATRVTRIQRNG